VQGAYVLKGNHWLRHGSYAEAEKMFRKAISSNWSAPIPHNQLGLVLQYQGKSDDAMAQFQRVVGIDPQSWLGYNNIGWVLSANGKVDQAIANYRRSIELNPRYALAYNNLALALGREGHTDQAIAEYRRAISSSLNISTRTGIWRPRCDSSGISTARSANTVQLSIAPRTPGNGRCSTPALATF
jgi:tetratricopeptide (TPR) repeat protein